MVSSVSPYIVTKTRSPLVSWIASETSLVGNGKKATTRSRSKLMRMSRKSARASRSVIALCKSHAAPIVRKLTR